MAGLIWLQQIRSQARAGRERARAGKDRVVSCMTYRLQGPVFRSRPRRLLLCSVGGEGGVSREVGKLRVEGECSAQCVVQSVCSR